MKANSNLANLLHIHIKIWIGSKLVTIVKTVIINCSLLTNCLLELEMVYSWKGPRLTPWEKPFQFLREHSIFWDKVILHHIHKLHSIQFCSPASLLHYSRTRNSKAIPINAQISQFFHETYYWKSNSQKKIRVPLLNQFLNNILRFTIWRLVIKLTLFKQKK